MNKRIWAVLGAFVTAVGLAAIYRQAFAGLQPWDGELSDAMIFAKSIPFTVGFGVLVGSLRNRTASQVVSGTNGAAKIRRYSRGTAVGHWINAIGFFCALGTGSWQYLRGVLEVDAPVPLYLFYRLHFIGATLMLFSMANFLTYWALGNETPLLVPAGQWLRHLRGLAHELPAWLGTFVGDLFGLDMKRTPPATEQFTYYEKTLSFPIWVFLLALITVTGLVKALRYVYPVPGGLLYWASGLHVAAMVMLAIKLLDHLRYVFGRWALLVSMATTWVSERYVQLKHPGWYKKLVDAKPAPPATTRTADASPGAVPGAIAGGSE